MAKKTKLAYLASKPSYHVKSTDCSTSKISTLRILFCSNKKWNNFLCYRKLKHNLARLGKNSMFYYFIRFIYPNIKEPFFFFGQDISIKVLELMWWPARWKILFSSVLRISRPVDKIIITSTKSAESRKAKSSVFKN